MDLTRRKLELRRNIATITGIKQIDLSQIDESAFKQQHTGCIVLTHDGRVLLQHRPDNWRTFPSMVATFGGHIETNETLSETIIRELYEELGAEVNHSDLVELGIITEEVTRHTELAQA